MNLTATKSSFGSVYLHLFLIAVSVIGGLYAFSRSYVAPQLINSRAESVLSLVRSHENDLLLSKTRSLRDELQKAGTIQNDRDFQHFLPDEKGKVSSLLENCQQISPSVCLGKTISVFLSASPLQVPTSDYKSAVALSADLASVPPELYLVEGILAVVTGLAFWLLYRSISKKENYLLERLTTASSAFQRTKTLFSGEAAPLDEFEAFGRSAEELVRELEDYKARFERKTRLEQLGLTVGQVSHDLKAPLNEADNFLSSLPMLMEEVSREQILEATNSLVLRIRSGKKALNQALLNTKRVTVARDELVFQEILETMAARAKHSKNLQKLTFALPRINFRLLGDQIRLETALLNLLENTAEEKPDANVRVEVSHLGSGFAKFTYEDNGRGIPNEHLDKVFEPLVTYKTNGTGLGLSSTKEILLQHGAQIRALPSINGAKFEITLPVLGEANA